jgi:DnaJ-domain-containing protein 1
MKEIALLGGRLPVLSSNIPLKQNGLPYAGQKEPDDKGVAVYFTLKGQQFCFACDRWDKVGDNIQAIRHTIAALRGIERWGTGDMVQQAFTGFIALPSQESPYDILGVKADATPEEIDAAYKQKARFAHPDAGGSTDAMQRLNDARNRLKGKAA